MLRKIFSGEEMSTEQVIHENYEAIYKYIYYHVGDKEKSQDRSAAVLISSYFSLCMPSSMCLRLSRTWLYCACFCALTSVMHSLPFVRCVDYSLKSDLSKIIFCVVSISNARVQPRKSATFIRSSAEKLPLLNLF